jgi:uncharacterized protein (DUF1810 family)
MADPLDMQKFALERYKTTVELEIKKMEAYANFNYRMMEVAELQIKNETKIVRLNILKAAVKSFEKARQKAMKEERLLSENLAKYTLAIARIPFLLRGEMADKAMVSLGWQGWTFLLAKAPIPVITKLNKVKCTEKERMATQFAFPSLKGGNAPTTINHAIVLMDWARKLGAIPKLGSKAQEKLGKLLQILGDGAEDGLEKAKTDLADAEKEFKRIDEKQWEQLKPENEKAKEA